MCLASTSVTGRCQGVWDNSIVGHLVTVSTETLAHHVPFWHLNTSSPERVCRDSVSTNNTMAASSMTTNHSKRPHIRVLRRQAGLTQAELAFLLGHRSHAKVSRLEKASRRPDANDLVMLEVIFAIEPRSLFPHLRDKAETVIAARIAKLLQDEQRRSASHVNAPPSLKAAHLRRVLEAIRPREAPGTSEPKPWPRVALTSESDRDEF